MLTKEDRNNKIKNIIYEALVTTIKTMHPGEIIQAPEMLWHYTNADSLESILTTKSIYSTQFNYLNDPSEIKLFARIAQHIASQRSKDLPTIKENELIETPEQYKAAWWNIIKDLDEILISNPICVTCFSESNDLLGQWQAYADNCKGYAIGISTEWLNNQTISEGFPFRLLKVIYHPKEQIKLISRVLDLVIDEASSILSEVEEKDLEETLNLMIDLIRKLAAEISPIVKHPAYSDEREWRLLSFGNPMNVRSVKGNFVQFNTINLNDTRKGHPFREIRIGPGNNTKIEKPAIGVLLEKLGLKNDIQISTSIIPIRAT